MKQLWCPWRIEYILGSKPDSCVFCIPDENTEDEERLILYRGQWNYVIMNKFPYSNGHIMVTPYKHIMDICQMEQDEGAEHFELIQKSASILRKAFNPQGINIGLNMGEAAGAGIKEHLHFHLVPRWNGDSSFMAILDEVRVIPEHLTNTYAKLKTLFQQCG